MDNGQMVFEYTCAFWIQKLIDHMDGHRKVNGVQFEYLVPIVQWFQLDFAT